MHALNRRSFLHLAARFATLMGLGSCAAPHLAKALASLAQGAAPVLWLQGQSCSGCSVSLLNAEALTPYPLLTRYINLKFHPTLSNATGHQAAETVQKVLHQGGYVLVVEGTVPAKMPRACTFDESPFTEQLARAARSAKAVLAAGTCAAFGGIPAAENNPTGAVSVPAYLKSLNIKTPTVLIPGCPTHPDWLVGTVLHLLQFGLPPLDAQGRPIAFFSRSLHDQCPRFADYERERFARTFGEEGCLFKLGCAGPLTHTDCNVRQWNGGVSTCIRAGAPCIGCAGEGFTAKAGFPLLTKHRASSKAS